MTSTPRIGSMRSKAGNTPIECCICRHDAYNVVFHRPFYFEQGLRKRFIWSSLNSIYGNANKLFIIKNGILSYDLVYMKPSHMYYSQEYKSKPCLPPLGRFRTSTNTITITNTSSVTFQIIKWYCICKRKMPTYRSKSTKSCSFGTSRTYLNEMARDDVMLWTQVPTK
jgi:hypothetical protein